MNVIFRFLKIVGIAVLIILNEGHENIFHLTGLQARVVGAVIGFLLVIMVAELARDILVYLYKKRKKLGRGKSDNVILGINNIYYLLIVGAGFYFILYLLKLKPRDFFTGFSLISAATAIIMKDYVANIISGMLLAFSDKIKIGDYVRIGNHKGKILDFSLTMISLENDDDELVYIPMNTIFTSDFTNYSPYETDQITIPFEINNKMKIPFDRLESVLKLVLLPYADQLITESNHLKVQGTHPESTSFKYQFTLKKSDNILARQIKEELLKAVFTEASLPGIK